MKRTIRRGVFETNSSSTHSICIVPVEDFEAWKTGKMILAHDSILLPLDPDPNKDLTVFEWDAKTRKSITKKVPDTAENRKEYFFKYDKPVTYKEWYDDYESGEPYEEEKIVKGVRVVAFGKYGYNG